MNKTSELLSSEPDVQIAHVLFIDVVGYSKYPMTTQRKILDDFQHAVSSTAEYRRALNQEYLISLPTGDGIALVFFTSPEAPLRCAIEIARAVRPESFHLRMGIHTGPVYRVSDINANRNVAGGGINLAQRVMDCGDEGHILISATSVDLIKQAGNSSHVFHELGSVPVKHGVILHLYSIHHSEYGNPARPRKLTVSQDIKVGDVLIDRYRLLEDSEEVQLEF